MKTAKRVSLQKFRCHRRCAALRWGERAQAVRPMGQGLERLLSARWRPMLFDVGFSPKVFFDTFSWVAEPSCITQHNPTINTAIPWAPESCFAGEPACRNSILYLSPALSASFISLMIRSFLGRCLQTSPWTPVCICLNFICLSVTLTYTNHSSHFVSFFCDLQSLQLGGDSIVADQVWNGSGCP